MKKKVLCIALALLMCTMVAMPAFADGEAETTPERAYITATFGLTHTSGSTYKMWARIVNPSEVTVYTTLALYDASYNYVTSISKVSSNPSIGLSKYVSLSSGTYHLRLTYTAEGSTRIFEKTYTV